MGSTRIMTQSRCWILPALVVAVAPLGCGNSAEAWDGIAREGLDAGMSEEALSPLLRQCRAQGWAPDEARAAFAPAFEACREGLPADPVLSRLAEGIGKGVPADQVAEAVSARCQRLARARDVLANTPGAMDGVRNPVLMSLTRSLEVGLDEERLRELMALAPQTRPGPLAAVFDGGEILTLSGFPPEITLAIMGDCLERELGRREVFRMVALARDKFGAGEDPASIRQDLWLEKTHPRNRGGQGRGPGGGGRYAP